MKTDRVHHLDWLKVLIVYGIVAYHVSLVFAYGPWLVSNAQRSVILSVFAAFCFPWGIPAMFLISGADAWFGLRSHSVSEFVRKRFLRLVVPFALGLVVLSPFQRFITTRRPPWDFSSLPAFYLDFYRGLHFDWSLQIVGQYWLHLWFLGYLFVISIVCAPLLAWLHGAQGRGLSARLADLARRGGVFAFAVPLLVSQLVLRPIFPAYQDWADVATYTIVFVWGAVVFSDRAFEQVVKAQIGAILAVAVASSIAVGLTTYLPLHDVRWLGLAQAAAWSVYVWAALHAVLYIGMRWFDFGGRAVSYLQESVLPVYVVHHPIVLVVASLVVTLALGPWAKFALILTIVLALTLAIYELGIRRWRITRALFGLGPLGPGTRAFRPFASRQAGRTMRTNGNTAGDPRIGGPAAQG